MEPLYYLLYKLSFFVYLVSIGSYHIKFMIQLGYIRLYV